MLEHGLDELLEIGKKEGPDKFFKDLKMLCGGGLIQVWQAHYLMGLACGYNECCIKNFVNLNQLGIPAAGFMTYVLGHKHIPGVYHVLCPVCYEKRLKEGGYKEQHLESCVFGKEGMPSTEENTWSKEEWFETYMAAA